jgi:iron complex outermembrane receptor protein
VEAGLSLRATPHMRVDAAYTYTDARFRRYTVGTTSYEGNAVPGIGPHRADVAVAYMVGGVVLAGDVRHQSRMVVNDANTAHSGPYTVADFRMTAGRVRAGRVHVRASGGIQNVFAARYNSSVVVNAFGRRFYEPGPGRTAHIGATVEVPGR